MHAWRNGSVLDFGFSGVYGDTRLAGDGIEAPASLAALQDTLFTPADRAVLEDFQPNAGLQAVEDYAVGRLRFGGGARYFGKYTLWDVLPLISKDRHQEFSGKWLADAYCGARVGRGAELTVGAQNLFNVYPDDNVYQNLFGTVWTATGGPPFAR